jgi:hypothetical protein
VGDLDDLHRLRPFPDADRRHAQGDRQRDGAPSRQGRRPGPRRWAVASTDHIEFAGTVIDTEGTSLFSPKLGLVVRSSGKASGSGSQGSGSGTYATELLNADAK